METELVFAFLTMFIAMILSGLLITGNKWGYKNIVSELRARNWKKYMIVFFLIYLVAMVYSFWLLGFGYDYIALMSLITYLISIVPEDIKEHKISTISTVVFAVIFIVLRLITSDFYELADGAIGFLIGGISLGVPFLIKREWIGLGDVLAVAVCGIILGFFGITQFLIRTFAFIVVYSIVLMIRKKASLKTELPFAPFLLIAAVI